MRIRILMALFVVVGLAACGGGDSDTSSGGDAGSDAAEASPAGSDDAEESDAAENGDDAKASDDVLAKLEQMASEDDGNPFAIMSQDERQCLAGGMVEQEDLIAAMLADEDLEDLSTAQQSSFLNLLLGCAGDTFASFLAEEMAADTGMTSEQATCVADGLMGEDGLLNDLMQLGLSDAEPSADVMGAMLNLMIGCDVPLG